MIIYYRAKIRIISYTPKNCLVLYFANHPGHIIQGEALVAADGELLIMVLPRSEEEQLAAGAGLHAGAAGLGKVSKAVLLQDDEGQAFVKGSAHDLFLALGDAGRDEDGSAASLSKEPRHTLGYLFIGEAARALHMQAHGALEEEAVADGGELLPCHHEAALHAEEVGMLALHQEAAGVFAEVVEPSLQLTLAQKQLVVEARGEE